MKLLKHRPVLVALLGDLHLNSTVALPPGRSWPKDDGGTYLASKVQLWILDAWYDYWSIIDAKQKQHKAELVVVLNGDLVDGDHHDTRQIISRMETQWQAMAAEMLDPVMKRVKPENAFIVRGTEAHSGKRGTWDEGIARDFGIHPARYDREGKVAAYSFDRLYLSLSKVRFDVKHHTTRSKVPRGKNGSAIRKASDIMQVYMNMGEWPPDVVVRSHVHVWEDSGDAHKTRCIFLPCWQAPTAYGYKIADDLPDIGGAWALCEDGGYELDKVLYPIKEEAIQWIDI